MSIEFLQDDELLLQQSHKEFFTSGEYLDYFPEE